MGYAEIRVQCRACRFCVARSGAASTRASRPYRSGNGMKRIEAVNDFVIKFANINGSGSSSANELFAKAVIRMGVPVSPRNIFPSNIQGMRSEEHTSEFQSLRHL